MNARTYPAYAPPTTMAMQLDFFGVRSPAPAIKHTDGCNKRHAAKLAYDAKYPDACKACHGSGRLTAPATREDAGLDEMCPDCMCNGRCPRCGHQHDEQWNLWLDDDRDPRADCCDACGWDPTSGDCRPDDDCGCDQTPDCPHAPGRLYSWYARDDSAPNGQHLCVACCDCGTVLH